MRIEIDESITHNHEFDRIQVILGQKLEFEKVSEYFFIDVHFVINLAIKGFPFLPNKYKI